MRRPQDDFGYRIDVLAEDLVVVEIKALEDIAPVHKAPLLSYLRLRQENLGLLINFNVTHLNEGIHRVLNGFNWKPPSRPSCPSYSIPVSRRRIDPNRCSTLELLGLSVLNALI